MPAKAPFLTNKQAKILRDLGQQIRDRRKELGISSVATAEAAELSRVTLYRIEKGEPSVAIGAYLSVVSALGLSIDLVNSQDKKSAKNNVSPKLPKEIILANYKQLKRLAWQLKQTKTVTPQEALDIYERNWRHIDLDAMDSRERDLIDKLLAFFGRRKLLV